MALSDVVTKTLENILIPLKGLSYSGTTVAVIAAASSITLSPQPASKAASIVMPAAQVGVIAGASCIAVQQVLIWDSRKRLEALRRRFSEVEARVQEQQRIHRVEVHPSPVVPEERVSFLAGLKREIMPNACVRCRNYHGITYYGEKGANRLICGMHPTGPSGETCLDWEGIPCQYRLVRIQGVGFSNLFFARIIPGMAISEILATAVAVPPVYRDAIMKRYRLKSASGLPGCVFESQSEDIKQAFKELLDSCFE